METALLLFIPLTTNSPLMNPPIFINQILRVKDQKAEVPILIVGNKKDLEENRQVKTREGAALAKKYGVDFIETSAKTGENIE